MISELPPEGSSEPRVLVAGDVTIDWNLSYTRARGRSGDAGWDIEDRTFAWGQPGGAGLLGALLDQAGKHAPAGGALFKVAYSRPPDGVVPADPRFHHTYSIWSRFQYEIPKRSKDDERHAWRVDRYLGAGPRLVPKPLAAIEDEAGVQHASGPDILVLDDANLGVRDEPSTWPWRTRRVFGDPKWIVYKMAAPIAEGALWEEVHRTWAPRVVAVMNANDLRLSAVQVSRELSWERTAQDLLWELGNSPKLRALSECRHVVVSFGPVGALLLTRALDSSAEQVQRAYLFFDGGLIEGMWGAAHPGGMIGYTACLTASIVCQLLWSLEHPDVHTGIVRGLRSMRVLHRTGYGPSTPAAQRVELTFPYDVVAAEFSSSEATHEFATVQIPMPVPIRMGRDRKDDATAESWTVLQERHQGSMHGVAELVALHGAKKALAEVPFAEFGDLLTIDRREIESYRSIRTLIGEYLRQRRADRPLSIAVFGAPGSGKSFGIVEVSRSLQGRLTKIEFNLAQFSRPDDLVGALHQVRDIRLSGDIPLVFWDEFDSNLGDTQLGWLRYFLGPMQDGKFQSGEATHRIGAAVFIFAGGTAERMQAFGAQGSDQPGPLNRRRTPHRRTARSVAFKQAKGPDFVSRLRGYVNVLGPNPVGRDPGRDRVCPIRRAIYLRSVLARAAPQLFEEDGKGLLRIDSGVLRAFIRTKEYRHGIRSMEAIVSMSSLADKREFVRSSLPSATQLNLHVDGRDFLAWLLSDANTI